MVMCFVRALAPRITVDYDSH